MTAQLFIHSELLLVDAIGSLTSTPESTNGVLTACPGDTISITCTHNITVGAITEWRLPGVTSQCLVVHGSPSFPNCAPFTVTMVSGGSTLSSTVEITSTEGLSGEVECLSGQNAASVSVLASVNISVAGEIALNVCIKLALLMQLFLLQASPWWSKHLSPWFKSTCQRTTLSVLLPMWSIPLKMVTVGQ